MKEASSDAENFAPVTFDAESIGLSLKEVAVDIIQTDSSALTSRWFHSKRDVDLFVWSDGNHTVIKHQVSFYGQVVEWNEDEGVKTGMIIEQFSPNTKETLSEIIHFDKIVQKKAVEQASEILKYVRDLSVEMRQTLLENLARSQSQTKSIRHFKQLRAPFWRRVKNWFSSS